MSRPKDSHKLDLVKIGVISSVHGVRGQVKIFTFTETPEEFFDYSPITDATGKREYKIKRDGIKDKQVIVTIEGLNDRNKAELLKGTEFYAPSKHEDNDELLTAGMLEGMQARLTSGEPYGKVIGLYNFGASDVIEIELLEGGYEMLPFNEGFIEEINAEENYMIVTPPEYLDTGDEKSDDNETLN